MTNKTGKATAGFSQNLWGEYLKQRDEAPVSRQPARQPSAELGQMQAKLAAMNPLVPSMREQTEKTSLQLEMIEKFGAELPISQLVDWVRHDNNSYSDMWNDGVSLTELYFDRFATGLKATGSRASFKQINDALKAKSSARDAVAEGSARVAAAAFEALVARPAQSLVNGLADVTVDREWVITMAQREQLKRSSTKAWQP